MVWYGFQSSRKPQLMFVFTQGVVDELHLLDTLNFRVVDYGFFGVITLWYFQLFFVLIVFALSFNILILQSLVFSFNGMYLKC
jgi:hypothetical protein